MGKKLNADGHMFRGGIHYGQSKEFKDFVRRRDKYTCRLCGEYGDIVDHIIPFAISRKTTLKGVRTLCRSCNLATRRVNKRKNLPLDQWYAKIEAELNSLLT